MSVEAKRGCGFRKVGGLYLAGGEVGVPCDRLPLLLDICPTCGGGIHQSRGWTWINVNALVQGPHVTDPSGDDGNEMPCPELSSCIFCGSPEKMGRSGLLWIGEKFYKTPAEFIHEGMTMGFSRRIKAIPRGFKIGETWVLLAHSKAVEIVENIDWKSIKPNDDFQQSLEYTAKGTGIVVKKPGVFYVWKPQRVEKIVQESKRGSEEIADLKKRGISPVFVPDDDRDHQGSVYDKDETEGSEE